MPDMLIACVQCGKDFNWSEEDQEFYEKMVFTKPRRCPHCRPDRAAQKRRAVAEGSFQEAPAPPFRSAPQRSGRDDGRYPASGSYIDQKAIVEFVQKVEDAKGFKRDVRLVFAHLIEEAGELSRAIWEYEKACGRGGMPRADDSVGTELLDIVFLACYLADILMVDLNALVPRRMAEIREEYGVRG